MGRELREGRGKGREWRERVWCEEMKRGRVEERVKNNEREGKRERKRRVG